MIKIKTIIDGLSINYIKRGSGKIVLILPGWGTTINTYMPLINNLSTYSTVYSLDMPGFGYSQEPDVSWNVDNYVDFVIKFIKKFNINELDLIGHSNGGRIIIKLLSKKDLDIKINKVILIGSAGIVHQKSSKLSFKVRLFKFCKKFAQLKPIEKVFPNLLDKVKNHFGSEDYRNSTPIMRETMVRLINEDLTNLLPNIKLPTLLIWGENDTATPIEDAKLMNDLIPNSKLIKLENCSHYVFLEKLDYVGQVIKDFLTGGNK